MQRPNEQKQRLSSWAINYQFPHFRYENLMLCVRASFLIPQSWLGWEAVLESYEYECGLFPHDGKRHIL